MRGRGWRIWMGSFKGEETAGYDSNEAVGWLLCFGD